MGYYTFHSLDTIPSNINKLAEHERDIEILAYGDYHGILFTEDQKWYHHTEHMKEYSKRYPDIVFVLSGCGETPDDYWKDYFQNGKVQETRGEIRYPDFDPKELK